MLRPLALAFALLISTAATANAAGPTGMNLAMVTIPKADGAHMEYKRLPRPPLMGSRPQPVQQPGHCITDGYIGKRVVADDAADAGNDDTITRAQLPKPARVMHMGDMATMDFLPNRLNLILDENDVVIEAKCG